MLSFTRVALAACAALAAAPLARGGTTLDRWAGTGKHGSISDDDVYAATGAFTSRSGRAYASGTLLGDGWVVTAAHVVDDASELRFRIAGRTHRPSAWVQTSAWSGDVLGGGDLALVRLDGPVAGAITASLAEAPVRAGASALIAGYGATGTGSTGFDLSTAGRLTGGSNVVDRVLGDLLLTDFDSEGPGGRENTLGGSRPTRFEIAAAPGDSGGGLYTKDASGWDLAGVTSFAAAVDGRVDAGYGDVSGYTALSPWADWIAAVRGASGDEGLLALGSTPPARGARGARGAGFEVVIVPEPAAALALAGLALLGRGGRRGRGVAG